LPFSEAVPKFGDVAVFGDSRPIRGQSLFSETVAEFGE